MTDTLNSPASLVAQVKEKLPTSVKASASAIKKALNAANSDPAYAAELLITEANIAASPANSDAGTLTVASPREAQSSLAEYGVKVSLKQATSLLKNINDSRGQSRLQVGELLDAYQSFLAQRHAEEMGVLQSAFARLESQVVDQNAEYAALANAQISEIKSAVDMATEQQDEFIKELRSYMGLTHE